MTTIDTRLTKAKRRLDALAGGDGDGIPFNLEVWRKAHRPYLLSYEREFEVLKKYPSKVEELHRRFAAFRWKLFDAREARALAKSPERADELRDWYAIQRERRRVVEADTLGPTWMLYAGAGGGR